MSTLLSVRVNYMPSRTSEKDGETVDKENLKFHNQLISVHTHTWTHGAEPHSRHKRSQNVCGCLSVDSSRALNFGEIDSRRKTFASLQMSWPRIEP